MKNMVKIYKGLMPEEDRLHSLSLFQNFPDSILSPSRCTDEPVYQLREYVPLLAVKQIYKLHKDIIPNITQDFELEKDGITLVHPGYIEGNEFLTVDKRVPGMSLPIHRDVPTGTYEKEFGLEGGMTSITLTGVFYWSDDFKGGEIKFTDELLKNDLKDNSILNDPFIYKPTAGDFIVFPSYLYHEILPITEGDRYSTQYFFNRVTPYHVSEMPNYEVNYLRKED